MNERQDIFSDGTVYNGDMKDGLSDGKGTQLPSMAMYTAEAGRLERGMATAISNQLPSRLLAYVM